MLGVETLPADRIELARTQAAAWGHVVVLKRAYTVVAAPNGRCHIISFANPSWARLAAAMSWLVSLPDRWRKD
ncbi:MAG: hypothetical protein R3E31_18780 [Chloroflexota bacterium]